MTLARFSNKSVPMFPSFFDKFFESDWMDWNNSNFAIDNSTLPALNILEKEDEFSIEVAAPGMKKENFNVSFENGCLTVSSEHKEEKTDARVGKYTRKEFSYKSFQRSFTISDKLVNSEGIKAKYDNGILYITLPKREEVKPKPPKVISIS